MDNFCIVVNTVSTYSDIWDMFFGQLKKHFPDQTVYVFTDDNLGRLDDYNVILYDTEDSFRSQYLSCIKQVKEEYVLYLNDDYVLYDEVNKEKIEKYVNVLNSFRVVSFIRLTRASINWTDRKFNNISDLFYLDPDGQFFFSQTATIWKRKVLEEIHERTAESQIGREGTGLWFETLAQETCKKMGITGLCAYNGESKKGLYHYDSAVFPYIATAIVSGRWNISEYKNELGALLLEYKVNPYIRGWM